MDPRHTNYLRQNIVFSYPEMIRVSFSLFLSLSVFCYFTLLLIFMTIILLLLLLFIYFFMKIIFIFSCSGMLRNVPECSMFLVLSTPDNSIAFVFTDKWQMADFMQITGRTLNVQPGNLHKIFSRFKARQAVKFLPVQTKESNESQTFHSPARQ